MDKDKKKPKNESEMKFIKFLLLTTLKIVRWHIHIKGNP
jgi:hypothetical protein